MRKPMHLATPLLAAAAVSLLSGCRPKQMQRCVDQNGNVVDDRSCESTPRQQQQAFTGGHTVFVPYRWYYGGGGGWHNGDHAYGGSLVPERDVDYGSPAREGFFSHIARGGFGESFGEGGAHASGEGGGGHGGGAGE